ncbi:MAG: tRNA (guanosine(37)-N1)-methyltransferase TrmD [Candidatus Zixiibacteriota bacterium]
MRIDIITTFPGMFTDFMRESMMARALQQGILSINVHDLRDFTDDPHRSVDDTPYGGGGGMILMAEPIARAIETIRGEDDATLIIPAARGELFHQDTANSLTTHERLIFVCGHYTAIDERVFDYFKPLRLCIGDYVLTGGELPTMVIVDAVARRLPGFLGNDDSGREDSFVINGLGAPHYTRPQTWRGLEVPSVLISGHHANVRAWRRQQARLTTEQFRPELLSTPGDGISNATAANSESHATGRSHDSATRKENDHG